MSETGLCPEHAGFISGHSDYPTDCTKGTHNNSKYGCPEEGNGTGEPCSKRNTGCPYAHNAETSYVPCPAESDFALFGLDSVELVKVDTLSDEANKLIAEDPSKRPSIIKEAIKTKANTAFKSKLKDLKENPKASGEFTVTVAAKKRILAWIDYQAEKGKLK